MIDVMLYAVAVQVATALLPYVGLCPGQIASTKWQIAAPSAQQLAVIRQAAERNDPVAQTNLGCAYETGQFGATDYYTAAIWYRKAAEQGTAEAQFHLAKLFYNGRGVIADFVESYKWLILATTLGPPEQRPFFAAQRDWLSHRMDDERRTAGQRQATEWLAQFRSR